MWTEATDASPGGATKPVWQVACGSPVQVYVNAIPTRVQFGNMQSPFAPEQIAATTEQAMAAAAREAELELLTLMYSASKEVKSAQYLGATRDLLATADPLAEQYRYSHWLAEISSLTAVFPAWAKGAIRADLARESWRTTTRQAGTCFAIKDAEIEDWFAAAGSASSGRWTA